MSSGSRAFGTLLQYAPLDGAAVTVGEVTGYGGVELSADTIDMTNHQSAAAFREFLQGLRDGGTVTLEGNHVPGDAGQAELYAHFLDDDDEARRMDLRFPDASGWTFNALCVNHRPSDASTDGKLGFTASLKLTGEPAWGASLAVGLTTAIFVLSEGDATVEPPRASTTYAYNAEVANEVASLTLTPTSAAGDTIYVNGTVVESGDPSGAIALTPGANLIAVVVEQDGKTNARYQIVVTRAAA